MIRLFSHFSQDYVIFISVFKCCYILICKQFRLHIYIEKAFRVSDRVWKISAASRHYPSSTASCV